MDTRNTATAIVDEWIKWQRFEGMYEGPMHPRTRAKLESLIAKHLADAFQNGVDHDDTAFLNGIEDTVVLTRKPRKKATVQ